MMIGFTKRVSTVPESDALEGEDLVPIDIDVAILRLAETEHLILFRLQSGGTAIVDPELMLVLMLHLVQGIHLNIH